MRRGRRNRGLLTVALMLCLLSGRCGNRTPHAAGPRFADRAEASGLTARTVCGSPEKRAIVESGGCGAALLDVDNDRDLDIYLVNARAALDQDDPGPGNRLYLNEGGLAFRDASVGSGADIRAWGTGCCAGDYDNDGNIDLYVTAFGRNVLLKGTGRATFRDVTDRADVADPGFSTGCAFFDADLDGHLDLYVVHYAATTLEEQRAVPRDQPWRGAAMVMRDPTFHGYRAEPDTFLRNRGDGTFEDASEPSGLRAAGARLGRGVAASDLDLDGLPDLYVANDLQPNFLFRNVGGGKFEEMGLAAGAAVSSDGKPMAGKGIDTGDVDRDGLPEIIVTNFAMEPDTLYWNRGGMAFEDATGPAGLLESSAWPMGWGALLFDADLDSDLDLFVANGHDYPQVDDHPDLKESYRQKNQLYRNEGSRFVEISAASGAGLQVAESSRGACSADLDNDGNLEILVTNMDAPPTLLVQKRKPAASWLIVELEGTRSNRSAIGARVLVTAGGRTTPCEVRSGRGFASHSDLRCHFGLGETGPPVGVEVMWPSGKRSVLHDVAPRAVLAVREP